MMTFSVPAPRPRRQWRARSALLGAAVVCAPVFVPALHAQAHDARIHRVEQNLLPDLVVRGTAGPAPARDLAARMRHYGVRGVSLAVIDSGRVVWARGYGTTGAPGDAAVTPETRFQAGSISKPVAAFAAMRLVDSGTLGLDEDVGARLRSWRLPEGSQTAAQRVTLRRLLSHSAGVSVHGFDGYAQGAPLPTLAQVLDGAPPGNSPPLRVTGVPGGEMRYSGGGYTIAQLLVEEVTGRPFARVVQDLVLDPLGMSSSGYATPETGTIALGHARPGTPVPGGFHLYPELAAAGLWSTPGDLARFVLSLQEAARGAAHARLSPAAAREMLSPQMDESGLGVFLTGTNPPLRFSHTGSTAGYTAIMIGYLDTGRGVVAMANADDANELLMEIIRGVAAEYGWPDLRSVAFDLAAVDPAVLARYEGRYLPAQGPGYEVSLREGQLFLTPEGRSPLPLLPASATRFFIRIPTPPEVTFQLDASGVPERLVLRRGAREVVAFRAPSPPR